MSETYVDYSARPEPPAPLMHRGLGQVRVESGTLLITDLINSDTAQREAFASIEERSHHGSTPGVKLLGPVLGIMVTGLADGLYDIIVERDCRVMKYFGEIVFRLVPVEE